jgi:hypothetical protein
MKRLVPAIFLSTLLPLQAHAAAGFSCATAENENPKLVVEGATPRSGGTLINFGAVLEIEDRKVEFKQSDVKRYFGKGGVIQVRISAKSGENIYTVNVNAKRNPKDEDDWGGTYEVTIAPAAAKDKAKDKGSKKNVTRGAVKCFVE